MILIKGLNEYIIYIYALLQTYTKEISTLLFSLFNNTNLSFYIYFTILKTLTSHYTNKRIL